MATPFRFKRSAVKDKRPANSDLLLGEIALNTYDGRLFGRRTGTGSTVALLNPWSERVGAASIYYERNVAIGASDPQGRQLYVSGNVEITGISTFVGIVTNLSTIFGTQVSVSGVSTFLGNVDLDADLDVDGRTELDITNISETLNVVGLATFASLVDFNADVDIDGRTELDITNIAETLNVVGITTLSSAGGITTTGGDLYVGGDLYIADDIFYDEISGRNIKITGIATLNTVSVGTTIGIAQTAYADNYQGEGGDLTLGLPNGGSYRNGAYVINSTDKIDNTVDELNFILGKLVPDPPDTINGAAFTLTGTAGVARLCDGFSPTNNTAGALTPTAGTQYTRNTDSTITSNYLTEYGPGDSGTVTGFVNAVGVGTTTLNVSFGLYAAGNNNGTYGALQIANNKDAADSTRNPGITSQFYEVYDARLINAASPDGFNKAFITQGSSTTQIPFWYEDPSTVSAPVISFSGVTAPNTATDVTAFSSGVPHFTESTNNNFTYVMTVTNASGDMYTSSTLVTSDGQTTGFANPGNKAYTDFAGGANPPVRNYGVGTGVTCLISNTPRNIHNTITANHFSRYDCSTPYGSHLNQRVTYSTNINLMGTSATTSQIDEDNILVSSLGTGSGNATRVNAGSTGDNPSPVHTSWSASGTAATYETIVRGGVLRHDQTDYSSGYLPVGPDYSGSRSGAQYFQMEFIRSDVSEFNIAVTGSYGGCWVCMPDNSTWTTNLSGTNGWADMFTAYRGAGTPITSEPGCASGGNMAGTSGTFTCVFGTESSSNDSNNRILIRWRLDSGDSITAMSFSAT